ncbi:SDR family oxidoreductase [Sphingopyxis sp. OPL5]|uniref:SDR family NAD(P)-dependent oxidoreductase n=1 Tax=Sphingopyxis sp. OPL5 TaxID=2486273 RepID=UPI00164EC5B0|nr:SDR family NAD(P)-dependent oxidoreductase [Sphingopyxis sp. OPL5]QNO27921.1 SDR family oxidoreductase [Sphingopyxis sp. OPL5]
MSRRFENKRVLLTGGASGIGRATAELFAREGARLVIGDIDLAGAQAAARELGGEAFAYDASNPASAGELVAKAKEALGGIDCLLNVAGIMTWGRFEETSASAWQRTLDINLSGPFYLSQAAIPPLRESKGCIVNVASVGGMHPVYGTTAYGVSKAGVIAMTKACALEFARDGIRVNAVAPGGVATPMHEKSAAGGGVDPSIFTEAAARNMPKLTDREACTPPEIAAAIAYLASDEARYATGTVLILDGGQSTG